jgi:hypothetical protein
VGLCYKPEVPISEKSLIFFSIGLILSAALRALRLTQSLIEAS